MTAGASAPESLVQGVVTALCQSLNGEPLELGENKEDIFFRLPPELR